MGVTPAVGNHVHYVSFGTPGGEYTSQCRAAIVTEVGAWMPESGRPILTSVDDGVQRRLVPQRWEPDACALTATPPNGLFFNTCSYDEGRSRDGSVARSYRGGTWHWPEGTGQ